MPRPTGSRSIVAARPRRRRVRGRSTAASVRSTIIGIHRFSRRRPNAAWTDAASPPVVGAVRHDHRLLADDEAQHVELVTPPEGGRPGANSSRARPRDRRRPPCGPARHRGRPPVRTRPGSSSRTGCGSRTIRRRYDTCRRAGGRGSGRSARDVGVVATPTSSPMPPADPTGRPSSRGRLPGYGRRRPRLALTWSTTGKRPDGDHRLPRAVRLGDRRPKERPWNPMHRPDPRLIDGTRVAASILAGVEDRARRFGAATGTPVCLAAVLVGDDPASVTYVRMKRTGARRAGITSRVVELPAGTSTERVVAEVQALSTDPTVHGILVQHPVAPPVDERRCSRRSLREGRGRCHDALVGGHGVGGANVSRPPRRAASCASSTCTTWTSRVSMPSSSDAARSSASRSACSSSPGTPPSRSATPAPATSPISSAASRSSSPRSASRGS